MSVCRTVGQSVVISLTGGKLNFHGPIRALVYLSNRWPWQSSSDEFWVSSPHPCPYVEPLLPSKVGVWKSHKRIGGFSCNNINSKWSHFFQRTVISQETRSKCARMNFLLRGQYVISSKFNQSRFEPIGVQKWCSLRKHCSAVFAEMKFLCTKIKDFWRK